MPEPAITFDDGETAPPADPAASGQPEGEPSDSRPSIESLQAEITELRSANEKLDQRVRDNRAHSDQLYGENRAANELLREAYKPKQTVEDLTANIRRPERPSVDDIIQHPERALDYADAMAEYTAQFTAARMTPIASAAVQMAPLVKDLADFRREVAISEARESLEESEREAFDQALPNLKKTIGQAQWGAKLALSPKAWLTAYAGMGGSVRPVRAKSTPPPTVTPNAQTPSATTTTNDAPVPRHIQVWAKQSGHTDGGKEMWKRMQARRQRPA